MTNELKALGLAGLVLFFGNCTSLSNKIADKVLEKYNQQKTTEQNIEPESNPRDKMQKLSDFEEQYGRALKTELFEKNGMLYIMAKLDSDNDGVYDRIMIYRFIRKEEGNSLFVLESTTDLTQCNAERARKK